MQTFVGAVVGLLAVALLVVGCDGDEAVDLARDCGVPGLAAEAERAAAEASSAQADESQAHEVREFSVDDERYALFEAASEAMADWYSRLETLTLEARSVGGWNGNCSELALDTTVQVDPLASLSVGDYSPWFRLETGLPLAKSDEAVQMQEYLYDGRVYGTVTGLEGWGASRWHWSHDYDDGALQQWLGVRPSSFASYDLLRDELLCGLVEGGAIVEDEYEGEAVWVVTCEYETVSLLPFDGDFRDSYDEALLREVQITISQESGAPLVSEYDVAFTNRDGEIGWTLRRIVLTSWNEPVELLRPEPLLEGDEFGRLVEEFRERASAPERLLELAQRWKDEQEEHAWTLQIRLETRDTDPEDWWQVSETRSPESIERTAYAADQITDGGGFVHRPGLRLLWNRDGFQVSEADEDGEPVWKPSPPAEHGFGDAPLEEVLAGRVWADLDLFNDLLKLSELEASLPDDGRRDYWLDIGSGVQEPGDPHFKELAALIERAHSGLRIGDIEILRIDSFDMWIRLEAGRQRIEEIGVGAVFETDSGMFTLSFWNGHDSGEDIW